MKSFWKLLVILPLAVFLVPQSANAEVTYDTYDIGFNVGARGVGTSETSYEFTGTYFSSSTTYEVGSITMWIQATGPITATTTNDVQLYVYKAGTSTPPDEWALVDVSLYTTLSQTELENEFVFSEGLTLNAGQEYLFEVRPLSIHVDSFDYILYGRTALGTVNQTFRHTVEPSESVYLYTNSSSMLRFESVIEEYENEKITLSLPCAVSNTSEYPCTFGYASTSLLEIQGTSTNMQSWYTGTYDVYVGLFDSDNRLIDYRTITDYTPNDDLLFYTTLEWSEPISALATIRACQVPSDGSTDFDVEDCAEAIIGYDMTTASTTDMASFFGYLGNDPRVIDSITDSRDLWAENGCDSLGLTDVFPALKCALIWAFSPSPGSLQQFSATKQSILTLYPIGYATIIFSDIASTTNSTSTAYFDNDINLGRWFGVSGTATTTISMQNLTSELSMVDKILEYFDVLLWLAFVGWLLIWGLTRKL